MKKKEIDFNIRRTEKNQYVITRNGRALKKEQIEKLYRNLNHYPFSTTNWAYYHLEQLGIFQQDKEQHKLFV